MEELHLIWREDIDALQFAAGNGGQCFIHRLALRTLLGPKLSPDECLTFAKQNAAALLGAARQKIEASEAPAHWNFHLDSRQIRRGLS
ncbi:hypothetical protein U8P80_26525 (plasmid) [Rhizobium beringeri]|uniref:Uncharacterized protein n=1 Tax=Rhizobium beringeri TaxID=3019934 RepID=A0ABY1XHS4_9HYPH|nr:MULTISPECIES: hypothetical protein [Rhizobium]NKL66500.1 hypothetical protein [Rhizobium leguminosarum bv. viciae]MBY5460581.1 hypothetical protein [Rhizobium leguminosarum]RWX04472.1 hypothetical protein EHI45_32280 [Rhizobium leguminosarum]TAU37984.1 hypothetical protein ELI43_31985 [Rhizobium leguminosarum]TBC54739.1 hypothetical protein ELH27_34985 [Rhizobium leguminosarum]